MTAIASATNARANIETARMAALTRAIQKDQSAVSSGRALVSGSDNPVAAARLDRLSADRAQGSAWASNLDLVARWAAERDTALAEANTILNRALELVSAGLSGTASVEARAAGAAELDLLAAALRELPNGQTVIPTGTGGLLTVPTGPASSISLPVDLSNDLPPADMFAQAAGTLRIDDGASRAAQGATVIAALTTATNQIIGSRVKAGAIANAANARSDHRTAIDIVQAEEQSELGQTDIAAAIARINAAQLTLDAAQALFARLNRSTLFDLLR